MNEVYGQCSHGDNMVTCSRCNPRDINIELIKNDPRYCYFLEHKNKSGFWLDNDCSLTNDPLSAMLFYGDEGMAKAGIYLAINQASKKLMNFKISEHEFVLAPTITRQNDFPTIVG